MAISWISFLHHGNHAHAILIPENREIQTEHIKCRERCCKQSNTINYFIGMKSCCNISSLLKKPANGGIPAIARQPIKKAICVTGISFLNPPISFISLLCTIWITAPAPRNNNDLKKACVNKWNMEAI
jgi:hypothetical protein